MVQLASVLKEPERKCRNCKEENLKAYLEIEGAVVFVRSVKPHPFGGSIFIHRGIFCGMKCFNEYLKKMYNEELKGREGKIG